MQDRRKELLNEFKDCVNEATQLSIDRAKKQSPDERSPIGFKSPEVFGMTAGFFIKKIADLQEQVAALQVALFDEQCKTLKEQRK